VDVIADQINPGGAIYFKVARQAAREPSSGLPGLSSLAGALVALLARPRASSAVWRRAMRWPKLTVALVLAALVAAAAVLVVAVPFPARAGAGRGHAARAEGVRQTGARVRRGA
jgi:hypothetical protein